MLFSEASLLPASRACAASCSASSLSSWPYRSSLSDAPFGTDGILCRSETNINRFRPVRDLCDLIGDEYFVPPELGAKPLKTVNKSSLFVEIVNAKPAGCSPQLQLQAVMNSGL